MTKIPLPDLSKTEVILPEPCPICGGKVTLYAIEAYEENDDGEWEASEMDYECESEPPIDSEDWEEWHKGHYRMPYVDWLPYDQRMLEWLNEHYTFPQ